MDTSERELVFVLGTGRCGSTLVHEVLARHPRVGFVSNVEDRLGWLPVPMRWNNELYRRVPPEMTRKGRLRFAPSEGYRILDRRVSPILSAPGRDLLAEDATPWLAGRLRGFFEERGRCQGKPVFLHKFTGWPRARFLHAVFPSARFIHVVRDGRAVANSLVQMPWWSGFRGPSGWGLGPLSEAYAEEWEASGRSFVVLAGLEWKLLIDEFERARAEIPSDRWLEIRYEDFVDDPRARTEEMLAFCGLRWTSDFESSFTAHTFSSSRLDAFRHDLGERQTALLGRVLDAHLERYGYAEGQTGQDEEIHTSAGVTGAPLGSTMREGEA